MKNRVLLITVCLFFSLVSIGQISGIKMIPGDYASIASAISALNATGVGTGGVTFNVAAGYTETFTSRTDGLITATGNQSDPIIFQKSGTGLNPILTAATPGIGNYDYIICIGGGDNITFDGIDIQDNPSNTTATTRMEYGFALLKASETNGAQNNTLKNSSIQLSFNTNAYGIYLNNWSYSAPGTALTVTSVSGNNSWNVFYGLNLINCYGGINLTGYADNYPFYFYDQGNRIGFEGGNTFTYSGLAGTSVNSYGINAISQNGLVIANNTFTGALSMTTGRYYAMNLLDSDNANLDIFNNTLSISFSGTGHFYGFYNNGMGRNGTTNTVNFYNNQIINNTFATHTSGNVVYSYATIGAWKMNVHNNVISNNVIGSSTANSTGLVYYMYFRSDPVLQSGSINYNDNTISNNSRSSSAATVSSLTYFLYNTGSTDTLNIYNNIIDNNTAVANSATCIMIAHIGKSKNIYNNTISNISGRIGSITGIFNANGAEQTHIYRNRLQNLSTTGNPSALYPTLCSVRGIAQSTGNNNYYYNNYLGQFYAPSSQKASGVIGIQIYGVNNNFTGLYHNTIYLDGTSVNDGLGAIGVYADPTEFDMRNNLIVNNVTSTGGEIIAYYRTGAALNTYQLVSNNNNFYAGTPGPRNLIYQDPGNSIQTLVDYKAFVSPRDAQSISENSPFINVTSTPYNLHLSDTLITLCESGGGMITTPIQVTVDYEGDPRYPLTGYPNNPLSPAISTDIGADEFAGIYADLISPYIVYTPLTNTLATGERTLTAVITDPSDVPESGIGLPVLYWKINSGLWNSAQGTWISGNTYNFTFGSGALQNDTVYYYVVAQDIAPVPNIGCRPIGGAGGFSSNPPACATPPSVPDSYHIVGELSGLYTVGVGKDYTTITEAVADLNLKEVVGPVIFELWDDTFSASETFPLVINPYLGASAEHPVTFRPKPAGVITVTGASGQGILILNGCRFITIDGSNSGSTDRSLTWQNTSATAGSFVIGLFNSYPQSASDCVIKNNTIRSSSQITDDTYGIFTDASWGGYNNITIDNNAILSARNGVLFAGKLYDKAANSKIINNTIGSLVLSDEIKFQGIVIIDAVNTLIQGNEIIGPASGNSNNNQVGVLLSPGAEYTRIDRNRFHHFNSTNSSGRASAINLATTFSDTPTEITNNLIYAMKANRYPTGIYISNGGNALIAHNSINFTDTTFTATATSFFYSACLSVSTGSMLDVRNNIFLNKQQCVNPANIAPKTYAVYSGSPKSAFTDINYNDYFVNDAVPSAGLSGKVGFLQVDRTTLSDWQLATNKDINSIVMDPLFVSSSNLHPTNPGLNNLGTYMATSPRDFEGNLRTNPADMGAYNLGNDPMITTLAETNLIIGSATLNGNALANNQLVNLFFDFGTTTSYSSAIPGNPLNANGLSPVQFNALETGLIPNAQYHYRARGVTASGLIIYGEDKSFTIPCIYPVISINGPSAICSGVSGIIYSTELGYSNYQWNISAGGTITAGAGTNSITVTWNTAGAKTVSVNYTNTYGCSALSPTVYNIIVNPSPSPTIIGSATGCQGSANNVYSTQSGMSGYLWNVTGGTITAGAGTNSITVTWNTEGTQTINVNYSNSNGCSAIVPTSYTVTVLASPIPVITGPNTACESSAYLDYTTEPGMTNYVWDITPNSGTISQTSTNVVTIFWTSPGAKWVSLSYTGTNGCSSVAPSFYNVTVNPLPGTPGTISGQTSVCAGTNNVSYSVTAVANATTYLWSLPAGASIATGTGTNSVTVNYSSNAVSGNVSVFAQNSCGDGQASVLPVTVTSLPLSAGSINGISTVCQGTTGVTYSVADITGATSYNWTVPVGAAIVSGTGTSNITVDFGFTSVSGNISVNGVNDCGTGTASMLMVTVNTKPATPVITLNANILTSDAPLGNQWYRDGVMIPGANAQTYTIPEDGTYTVLVTLNGCSSEVSNSIVVLHTGQADRDLQTVNVYPNPTTGEFWLLINSKGTTVYEMKVLNSFGAVVYKKDKLEVNGIFKQFFDLKGLSAGMYTLILNSSNQQITKKIVIN